MMTSLYPLYTILPRATRVSQAVQTAQAAGADLWITERGQVIVAPIGRPGWRRLTRRPAAPVAAPLSA